MQPYKTKAKKLAGTNYRELRNNALILYVGIKKRTKRRPYIRSAYWQKEKIFFDYFWDHLFQKAPKERFQRLKYFAASIELIEKSRNKPVSKLNPNKSEEMLHRFAGLTHEGDLFFTQIKEDKKRRKYFMSCFTPE